jgi:hypothetical protein
MVLAMSSIVTLTARIAEVSRPRLSAAVFQYFDLV